MILDGNGHTGFFRDFKVRLHFLEKDLYARLEISAFQSGGASSARYDGLASKPLSQSHFVLQTQRPQLVLSDASKRDVVLFQHRGELLFTEIGELFPLISVHFGPDVQRSGSRLTDFRQDLTDILIAVHAGTENILQTEWSRVGAQHLLVFSGGSHRSNGSGSELTAG